MHTIHGGDGWLRGVELDRLSDEAFFLRMRACGSRVRVWDDRYIGLLVGAEARGLPRQRGFRDIAHMAALQARMSRKKVLEVLRIARAIRDCPGLTRLFTRAEVSWTKIRSIATIARPEWDADLCVLVRTQTRKDIELWLRERARQSGAHPANVASIRDSTEPRDAEAVRRTGPLAEHGAAADPDHASSPAPGTRAGATVGDGNRTEVSPEMSGVTSPAGDTAPSGAAHAHRAATPEKMANTLAGLGIDPLAVEKLLLDREALGLTHGRRESLAWVLEQAILAYRPSARRVKLPHVLVLTRCPDCHRAFVDGQGGVLPVDEGDAGKLRRSGAAVDLDRELEARDIEKVSDDSAWSLASRSNGRAREQAVSPSKGAEESSPAGDTSPRTSPHQHDRSPVPARDVRSLMALQRGRCAFPGCAEPPSEIHHRDLYDRERGHELSKIHLVCRDHHRTQHTGAVENPSDPPARWRIRATPASGPPPDDRRRAVDRKYREHLQAAERRDRELGRVLGSHDDLPCDGSKQ